MTKLNEQQSRVVAHQKGHAVVASVPGSGKTTTVVHFIADLVQNRKVDPVRICASTFSKKAAEEMNSRLEALIGKTEAQVSTLHSLSLKIVRDGSEWAHYGTDGGVWSDRTISNILSFRHLRSREPAPMVDRFISLCKAQLLDSHTVAGTYKQLEETQNVGPWMQLGIGMPPPIDYVRAYSIYEEMRHTDKHLTFDDMVYASWAHLSSNEEARLRWQHKFDWIIVDEFQDTNYAQYELIKILGGKASIVVVGDDDQSIYGFRQAKPEFLIYFKELHNATTYAMESNYRSGGQIIEHANQLIDKNKDRISKVIKGTRELSGQVEVWECEDTDDEARRVAEFIAQIRQDGVPLHECAILYRTNAYSQAFEDVLKHAGLPFIVYGSYGFFDRTEIKGLVGYLRAAAEPENFNGWKDCINRPFRFFGKKFLDDWDRAAGKDQNYRHAAKVIANSQQLAQVNDMLACIEIAATKGVSPGILLKNIEAKVRYTKWVSEMDGYVDGENDRTNNVWRLIDIAMKYPTVEAFLHYIDETAAERKRRKTQKDEDKIQVMTIHRSKGLEFRYVFVAGLAYGILPHPKSEDLEEERRLCYVAITRAKDHLVLSYPRLTFSGNAGGPSRFVAEAGLLQEVEDGPASTEDQPERSMLSVQQ